MVRNMTKKYTLESSQTAENIYKVDSDLKINFIEEMALISSDSMMDLIKKVMKKIDLYESIVGKSIYNYTIEMYKDILGDFRASSVSSLNSYFSVIKKYIEYSMDKRDNVNLDYKLITSKEMEKLVNKVAHDDRYITRDELTELISNAINPQDMALLILIFEGVRGVDYDDIRLLKTKDIDFNNGVIHLKNKDIKVESQLFLSIIKEATKQLEYVKYLSGERASVKYYKIHEDNEYVIKRLMHKSDGLDPYVGHRLKVKVSELTSEMGREHLTGTTIYNSGLAERLLKEFNRHPDDISDKEIRQFLEERGEKIPCASLRRIARYILEK